jgi:hypothetical protein
MVAAPAILARRRRFLTGGAVTGATIVTLASRSALANCTISGMISGFGSHAHRSEPSAGSCGSNPQCWIDAPATSWTKAGYSKTNDQLSSSTGSGKIKLPGSVSYTDKFGGGAATFTMTATNLSTVLSGGTTATLTFTESVGNQSASLTIPGAFLAEYVAAFLNTGLFDAGGANLYGHSASAIAAVLAAIQSAGVNTTVSGFPNGSTGAGQAATARVNSARSNLNGSSTGTTELTGWNGQGTAC